MPSEGASLDYGLETPAGFTVRGLRVGLTVGLPGWLTSLRVWGGRWPGSPRVGLD